LYRYLLAKKDALFVPLMLGTANVSLKERDIADVVIPLPPLAEQQRIVGRIEEVASQLQSAGRLRSLSIEETEHVFALTRDRLFASISSRRAPIRDCFRLINGRAFRPEDWSESGMKIVRIQNLKYPDAPFNHFQGSVDERHLVRSGDVLFAWSGQVVSLGAHIWAGEDAILNQHIFNVRFGADLSAPFVRHGWNALVDEMKAQVRGLEMFHIRKQELEQMLFPIPTRAEQAAMVEYLDALQREVDALKQLQERSHAELDALLPAILDRAFAGAL
jgi:restriction endonuclease S subunit